MGKLVMMLGSVVVGEYALTKESTTIGRLPDNDIQASDPAVSRRHAVVNSADRNVVLEDLNSTNGTLVNSSPVKKWLLSDGDVIQIGQHQLRYVEHDGPAPQPPLGTDGTSALAAPSASAYVRVLDGPEAGKVLRLTKSYTPVGTLGVQVAAITRRPEGYSIINVGGGQGLALLNGRPIGNKGETLQNQDIIEVAGTHMEFVFGRT